MSPARLGSPGHPQPLKAFGQLPSYSDDNRRGHLPSLKKSPPDCSTTVPGPAGPVVPVVVGEVIGSPDRREVAAPSSAWRQF